MNQFHILHEVGGEEVGLMVATNLSEADFRMLLAYIEFEFETVEEEHDECCNFFENSDIIEVMKKIYGCEDGTVDPDATTIERWANREMYCGKWNLLHRKFENPDLHTLVDQIYVERYLEKK